LDAIEATAAKAVLESGKYLYTSNLIFEEITFSQWEKPNFREKTTNKDIDTFPVTGWNYDVLIGGLYPDQKPEWEWGLHGYTLELAFPIGQANKMLKRVRELFDAEKKKLIVMSSTYRSGINIKFGKAYDDFLGQTTSSTSDGADWSKGAIMFDFPSFHPTSGDRKRFNEQFCKFSLLFIFLGCFLSFSVCPLTSSIHYDHSSPPPPQQQQHRPPSAPVCPSIQLPN